MLKLITAIALAVALPAVVQAQAAPAPAPEAKQDCCEKRKSEGKECCCKDMAGKDHADHGKEHGAKDGHSTHQR